MLQPEKYVFGPFVFDPGAGRLSKHGYRIKLERKSAALLDCLLERSGEVVPSAELERRLWPEGTYVDYDLGIRVALKKLRGALCDSSNEPTYIQTIRGEGFRFIAPVTVIDKAVAPVAPPAEPAPVAKAATLRLSYGWLIGTVAVLLAVIVAISWRSLRPKPIQFHAHDWVLIADFDNMTGEKLLDHALEYALERELSNSTFASVVPRPRVEDTLRLMQQPLDAKITPAIGRQICLRDGGIKALLTGEVQKLGTTYVLTAKVVDPSSGVTVATISEEDPADTQLAASVRRVSNRVRAVLGEGAQQIQATNDKLEKVTTPSLRALQLYSEANDMMTGNSAAESAAELLKAALRDDPNFASAHVLLAYVYFNQGKGEEAAPHFRRAFELADKTSERERYFILGSYYGQPPVNDLEKAAKNYETLLRLYPDHQWAPGNLTNVYYRMGRPERADDVRLRMSELRPNDIAAHVRAAWALTERATVRKQTGPQHGILSDEAGFREVQAHLDRAIALRGAQASEWEPGTNVTNSPRLLSSYVCWLEGKALTGQRHLVEAARFGKFRPETLALFYAAYGELREAEKRASGDESGIAPSMIDYYRGDLNAVRRRFRGIREVTPHWSADVAGVMMAHAGLYAEAERVRRQLTNDQKKRTGQPGAPESLDIVDGELALAKGDTAAGVHMLEKAFTAAMASPPSTTASSTLMAAEDLAAAYRKRGQLDAARQVLERAAAGPVVMNFSAAWQLRIHIQLAQVYIKLGRAQDATRVEYALAQRLALADPDHPIVRQLAALRQAQATPVAKK